MKNILLVVLLLILVTISCIPVMPNPPTYTYTYINTPTTNPIPTPAPTTTIPVTIVPSEPPVAYIDTISVASATIGTNINFSGHGTDKNGTVVGYEWRSSLDGIISKKSNFDISTLSVGRHDIYFRVQNNRGDWSKEIYGSVSIVTANISKPVVNLFEVKPEIMSAGGSTTMRWDVSNATKVSIIPEIGDVALTGTRVLNPKVNTTYKLTASNEMGQVSIDAVVVMATEKTRTVELIAVSAESGSVKMDGIIDSNPWAGSASSGQMMQAFFSFDISVIPAGSIIKTSSLDLSIHNIYGYPFNLLGGMGVFHHEYGTLSSNKYVNFYPGGAMYTSYNEPSIAYVSNMINGAIQEQVDKGNPRFQIRVQFEKYFYNSGGQANYIAFRPNYTKLIITYE